MDKIAAMAKKKREQSQPPPAESRIQAEEGKIQAPPIHHSATEADPLLKFRIPFDPG